jgi:hypothetical protein
MIRWCTGGLICIEIKEHKKLVMAHDVFISYSSIDKSIADAICSKLEQNGVKCWYAPRDVRPGANYGGEIVRAIRGTKVFVLVFSEHSNLSKPVLKEIERAYNKEIVIIPFKIHDIPLSDDMEFYISDTHWLDGINPPLESHIKCLNEQIIKILDRKIERNEIQEDEDIITVEDKNWGVKNSQEEYKRENEKDNPRFTEKNVAEYRLINDSLTGITWLYSHTYAGPKKTTYKGASKIIEHVNKHYAAGYNNWQLPTLEEAKQLILESPVDRSLNYQHSQLYSDKMFRLLDRIWIEKSSCIGDSKTCVANFVLGKIDKVNLDTEIAYPLLLRTNKKEPESNSTVRKIPEKFAPIKKTRTKTPMPNLRIRARTNTGYSAEIELFNGNQMSLSNVAYTFTINTISRPQLARIEGPKHPVHQWFLHLPLQTFYGDLFVPFNKIKEYSFSHIITGEIYDVYSTRLKNHEDRFRVFKIKLTNDKEVSGLYYRPHASNLIRCSITGIDKDPVDIPLKDIKSLRFTSYGTESRTID